MGRWAARIDVRWGVCPGDELRLVLVQRPDCPRHPSSAAPRPKPGALAVRDGGGPGASRKYPHPAAVFDSRPHSQCLRDRARPRPCRGGGYRSEEHTSELQSQFHLVCRLLLEKKKKKKNN